MVSAMDFRKNEWSKKWWLYFGASTNISKYTCLQLVTLIHLEGVGLVLFVLIYILYLLINKINYYL